MSKIDFWGDLHQDASSSNRACPLEGVITFLYTHPVPIFVQNTVHGFLGNGLDIPATQSVLYHQIRESLKDLTAT